MFACYSWGNYLGCDDKEYHLLSHFGGFDSFAACWRHPPSLSVALLDPFVCPAEAWSMESYCKQLEMVNRSVQLQYTLVVSIIRVAICINPHTKVPGTQMWFERSWWNTQTYPCDIWTSSDIMFKTAEYTATTGYSKPLKHLQGPSFVPRRASERWSDRPWWHSLRNCDWFPRCDTWGAPKIC